MAHDHATHSKGKDRVATEGLMWLLRGLKFTAMGLRHNLTNTSEELSVSFNKAYEGSLRKYHSIMIRPIFSVRTSHKTALMIARDEGVPLPSDILPQARRAPV